MRKQILKGFTMLMLIVALALVTAVASANGQSQKMVANIPFEFIVGDKALASGSYSVAAITSSGDTLRIKGDDTKDSALRMTILLSGRSEHAKLVFHRYGSRYFLAEVWSAEDGKQLMKSKQERAVERELASNGSKNETAQAKYERVEILATAQ